MQSIRVKLITSNSTDLFEERLQGFIASLGPDDVVVDIKFSTAAVPPSSIEFSALVHYQRTESWD